MNSLTSYLTTSLFPIFVCHWVTIIYINMSANLFNIFVHFCLIYGSSSFPYIIVPIVIQNTLLSHPMESGGRKSRYIEVSFRIFGFGWRPLIAVCALKDFRITHVSKLSRLHSISRDVRPIVNSKIRLAKSWCKLNHHAKNRFIKIDSPCQYACISIVKVRCDLSD